MSKLLVVYGQIWKGHGGTSSNVPQKPRDSLMSEFLFWLCGGRDMWVSRHNEREEDEDELLKCFV